MFSFNVFRVLSAYICLSIIVLLAAVYPASAEGVFYQARTGFSDSRLAIVSPDDASTIALFPAVDDLLIDGMTYDPSTHTLFGMGRFGYASGSVKTGLFNINPTNGQFNLVGELTSTIRAVGGLAVHPGTGDLYLIENANSSGGIPNNFLYQIDKLTGQETLIGDTEVGAPNAMAFAPDGTLYISGTPDRRSSNIYEIDPSTATQVSGPIVLAGSKIIGLTYDDTGTLFGTYRDALYEIHLDGPSPSLNTVGLYTNPEGLNVSSLAYGPVVPEPATGLILLTLIAANRLRPRHC